MKQFFFIALSVMAVCANAQSGNPFAGWERLFIQPPGYVAGYAAQPPVIDGNMDDEVWQHAEWTAEFQDIEGDAQPLPYNQTKVKMVWDEDFLYIAASLADKHVWANLNEHDQIIFYDNDFEVFIDPFHTTHQYYEIEINALNTVFDLFLPKPYRSGGRALISWDCKGLQHAVNVNGTLNRPDDEDEGWTVEMAIPFKHLVPVPPVNNTLWRLGFSRVQWETLIVDGKYVKKTDAAGKNLPEHNWVWSPVGAINMHMPERWGYLQFSTQQVGAGLPAFEMPYGERQRQYLWLVYYKQQQYRRENKKYARSLGDLGIDAAVQIDGKNNTLSMEASSRQFTVLISDAVQPALRINNEGLVGMEH
ncbi:MAG: carbohydrate-binding family 9-like protein [Tannerella sp.]|nr:carbohydrate-binding family 9-like protein [Tannerella sp.]